MAGIGDINYKNKIDDIKKLFKNWQYRYLTPYGKITVIKSLALSKLIHLVCVLPSLNKKMINEINQLCYGFLWDNKPDKVSRKASIIPEKQGGLGMKCIQTFWISIQCSWFRRIRDSSAFWIRTLQDDLTKIGENLEQMTFGKPELGNPSLEI